MALTEFKSKKADEFVKEKLKERLEEHKYKEKEKVEKVT